MSEFWNDQTKTVGVDLGEVTIGYLRAKSRGDNRAAAVLAREIGTENLLAGVTAAFLTAIRAGSSSVEEFLDELAMPPGTSAFVRRL